jgi:hypothetical protein
VRNTLIGVFLNGRRYPLRWPWQNQKGQATYRGS